MNERIRELAEQATTYIEPTSTSGEGWIFDKEKFAELIVEECIKQIQICSDQIKNDDGYAPDNFWPIMQSIVDAVAEDVKEHFGVEE